MKYRDYDRPKRAFSITEVAETYSVSKGFVRKEIREGRLRATCFGRRVLILAKDLEKYESEAKAR